MTSRSTTPSTGLFRQLSAPWTPQPYMKRGVKFLIEHAAAGLFAKPGRRKTSMTLAAITFLKRKGLLDGKVLIVAPVRVCYHVWPAEAKKWKDFNHLRIEILHGPDKDEALKRDADIYVINPEGLDWLLATKKVKVARKARDRRTGEVKEVERTKVSVDVRRFKQFGFELLVVDELSKFKHHGSGRFKALKLVLHTFGRRWGLTGSPMANRLMDLFGQIYVLDLGRSFSPHITHFRRQYFIPNRNGFTYDPQENAEERIYERLSPLVMVMGDDTTELPELVQNDIMVDLPPKAMAIYRELEKDLITAIEQRVVTARSAATASTKCRQVANGGVYLDPELLASGLQLPKGQREWVNLHDAKTDALEDLVDELQGSPLLVAYDFRHDLDRLRKRFKDAIFVPDYPGKQLDAVLERWNDGSIPLMFGHPQSIGHGLNMQGCAADVAWHSMTWDFDLYDQMVRRVYRPGNKAKRVTVHHLLATDTIDLLMLDCINRKDTGQQGFFTALKNLGRG